MRTRRIAVVGLADDAGQAFRSMLKILDGRGGVSWSLVAPDAADVLIAGTHGSDSVARHWAATAKPLIAVYDGAAVRPVAPYALRHPFRVMQLLDVLEDIDQALCKTAAEGTRLKPVSGAVWSFPESLRQLARGGTPGGFHVAGSGAERVFVRDDLSVYHASPQTVQRLAREPLELPALTFCRDTPPVHFETRPMFELAWFSGWHAADTLAPWIKQNVSYRLRRWPDFGMLRGARDQLALAAILTRTSCSRAQLIKISGQPAPAVDRFLNASALSGVLTSTGDAAVPAESAGTFIANSAARLGGLIRGLRSRLGLAS